MNILIIIISIILTSLLGYFIIKYWDLLNNSDDFIKFSLGLGLGIGLICTQLYLYSSIGITWNKFTIILPWLLFIIYGFFKKPKLFEIKKLNIKSLNLINGFLLLLILFTIFYTTFEALIRPPVAWDSWATWLFQSKVFFLDGKINSSIFTLFNPEYPFTFNLYGTFSYLMLGRVDDFAILLNSTAFYIYLGILFFAYTKSKFGTRTALTYTFLLFTVQNLIRHGGRLEAGIADLPIGYYSLCIVILFLEYLKNLRSKNLIILSFFLGFISMIKLDGIIFSLVLVILTTFFIIKKRKYNHLLFILIWLFPMAEWRFYKFLHYPPMKSFAESSFNINLPNTINAFMGSFKEIINVKSWNLIWLAYFYTVLISFFRKSKEIMLINIIILSQLICYLLIYILFSNAYNPQSSIERILIHIAPLAILEIAYLTNNISHSSLKYIKKPPKKSKAHAY